MKKLPVLMISLLVFLSSCAVVRQGEVGVKRTDFAANSRLKKCYYAATKFGMTHV